MIAIKRFYLVFVQYNHQIETNLIKKKTTIPLFRDRFVFTDDRLFFYTASTWRLSYSRRQSRHLAGSAWPNGQGLHLGPTCNIPATKMN